MADNEESKKTPTYTFFKKPSRNKNIRKREGEADDEGNDEASSVVPKPKQFKKTDSKLHFSSANLSKKSSQQEDTEFEIPSTFFYESSKEIQGKASGDEKLYKGIHGYTDFKAGFRREQTIAGEKAGGAHGPLRASANIRTSVRLKENGMRLKRSGR
ncbi:hypothetical protein KI387_035489 [Taxus chinensis]|uniref:Uncharacterized protein n=1 Tax=Taxus chinensis TaxID=29808 RepID=A0AA38KJC4_TAXCH|nr:hypothetical protein KI387_035489 [Taxus chinensis]